MTLLGKYNRETVGTVVSEQPVTQHDGSIRYRTHTVHYVTAEQRKQALRAAKDNGAHSVRDIPVS